MKKIYFICTGNSCRSQMAEGVAKKYFSSDWDVASAGIKATSVNPLAIKVMAESGIDISQNKSTTIDEKFLDQCDLVVTLCGDARDNCPTTPPTVKKLHWPLTDPAQVSGNEQERLAVFREVRAQIQTNVEDLSEKLVK